ncbi:MAG TPA: stage II sporulation protein P [Bacillota bacterium]
MKLYKHWQLTLTILGVLFLTVALPARGEEELDRKFFVLKDPRGKVICRTAHRVVAGDRYLNSENQLYEVTKTSGTEAFVKPVRESRPKRSSLVSQVRTGLLDLFRAEADRKARGPIGIYHTHTAEAYLPSEGVNSKQERGGIVAVGDAITKTLEENGIPVIHSKTSHVPQDAMAYDRSRRTAARLLKEQPPVLLDVHRDAVPREEYLTMIDNKPTAKIQFVVGRENPNFQANNEFAKRVKQAVDRKYPGLVKGIFYGKGKYNQDMGPSAMLLECGTNTNSQAEAIRGGQLFAAAAKDVLYGGGTGNQATNRGSWRSIFIILAALAGGIGIFFALNRRGVGSLAREFTGNDQGGDQDQDNG